MIKLIFGSFVAAIGMFVAGFLYFAGPLALVGYSTAGDNEGAALQAALATNLPATGTYMIPNPSTQAGTILYGKGPVATVHYNSHGFALDSVDGMIWGFALYLVVACLMAGALSQLDRRVPDFKSRAIITVCFAVAASAMIALGDPIWLHHDWRYAIFNFVGDVLLLCVGGLILARWFMPQKAELEGSSPAGQIEKPSSVQEVPPVDSPGL